MPVGLVRRREGPVDRAPCEARPHVRVLVDVAIIVITDKRKVTGLVVEREREDDQQQRENKRPLLGRSKQSSRRRGWGFGLFASGRCCRQLGILHFRSL